MPPTEHMPEPSVQRIGHGHAPPLQTGPVGYRRMRAADVAWVAAMREANTVEEVRSRLRGNDATHRLHCATVRSLWHMEPCGWRIAECAGLIVGFAFGSRDYLLLQRRAKRPRWALASAWAVHRKRDGWSRRFLAGSLARVLRSFGFGHRPPASPRPASSLTGSTGSADLGLEDGRNGRLVFVAVIEEARRRGIGTALTDLVCRYLQEEGRKEVRLYVEADNSGATEMYARTGFAEHGRFRDTIGPEWLVLSKSLGEPVLPGESDRSSVVPGS